MKTKQCIRLFMVLLISVFTIACSPEDGQNGLDGKDGETGPQGEPGNANVFVSDWKTATGIKDTIIDASKLKIATVAAPEINADNISKIAVMVYFNFGGGAYNLPYTSNAGFKVSTISYYTQEQKIRPIRFTHDNSGSLSLPAFITYRYVIIPQSENAVKSITLPSEEVYLLYNGNSYTLKQLKAMPYKELCNALNISE